MKKDSEILRVRSTLDGAKEINMENQHRKITGYRELNQQEIDLMNKIKAHFAETAELVEEVNRVNRHLAGSETTESLVKESEAFRWASIAKTHAQEASMALTRSVAKPEFF